MGRFRFYEDGARAAIRHEASRLLPGPEMTKRKQASPAVGFGWKACFPSSGILLLSLFVRYAGRIMN
jgi:hypothetical protein